MVNQLPRLNIKVIGTNVFFNFDAQSQALNATWGWVGRGIPSVLAAPQKTKTIKQ